MSGVCYGWSDVETSLTPPQAADALRHWPERETLKGIWSSPSARTLTLAQELATRWRLPLRIDSRLRELHFGRWEGRRYRDLEQSEGPAFSAWMSDWQHRAPPGGERLADLIARVGAWASRRSGDAPQLLIAHAGVVRALRVLHGGLTAVQAFELEVPHLRPEPFDLAGGQADNLVEPL